MSEMNDRGEFTGDDGKLYHAGSRTVGGDGNYEHEPFIHEGEWLKCEGCNPLVVVGIPADGAWPEHVGNLVDLRREYDAAKAEAEAAAERFETAKGKLKGALSEATNGAYRAELRVPGYKPVTLLYTEPWRVDSKRLQAEQPAVYVEYAKRGSQWTLAESKAKS